MNKGRVTHHFMCLASWMMVGVGDAYLLERPRTSFFCISGIPLDEAMPEGHGTLD